MNYKRLISSRKLRIKILSLLSWIPDRMMISLQYRLHTGRKVDLKNPERYTEKLQLYKLEYHDSRMLRCTDKVEVRKVLEEKGLGEILIPLVGVYDNYQDIDFDKLPLSFVAKTNDGCGGNQVILCQNKSSLDAEIFRGTLKEWMEAPKRKHPGREWAYENGYPRRIIIEQLLTDGGDGGLMDYKFFCFNGKVKVVYLVHDRKLGRGARLGVYSSDFEKLNVLRNDELPSDRKFEKPKNYQRMIEIAELLSADFPHVRVDLYNLNGKIYFGELTFYDGSGYMSFTPDSFDMEMGRMFDYPFQAPSRASE